MRKKSKAERRIKHLNNLAKIFSLEYGQMKVVFKDLKAIEMQGHKASEDCCNGVIDCEQLDQFLLSTKEKLLKLLPKTEARLNLYLNTDPRGHFLKINDEHVRKANLDIERDWGGYGIICPEEI